MPRGRPTLLTAARADELVRLIGVGSTLANAAQAVGISPRALRAWRARAWSQRPEDQPHVQLERRLVAALAVWREPPALPSWEAAAAALEAQFPERWSGPASAHVESRSSLAQ
jgi:hypothetical protein